MQFGFLVLEDIGNACCFVAKICKDSSFFWGSGFRVGRLFWVFTWWEGVIVFVGMQDMSDGLRFNLFAMFTDGVGVQSVGEESYGTEFMARGVAGIIWDDVVSNSWFLIHCKVELTWTSMDGNVQKTNRVVVLLFNCEIELEDVCSRQ